MGAREENKERNEMQRKCHQRNVEMFLYFQRQRTINTNVQFNVVTQTYAIDAENLNIVNKKIRKQMYI